MKKLRSSLYTKEKIILRNRRHQYLDDENGYLFAQGTYSSKIKAEDLPEWYVYGRYYKCFGYLSAKGVVDMKYVPSRYSNHFLKDDFLFISYNTMISENPEANSIIDMYTGYDERINGNEILDFLKAVRKYSAYDISGIAQMIQEKADWIVQANYNFVVNILKKETFGQRRIDKVKTYDAKAWLIKLQEDGRGYSTIHSIRGVVRPAFQMAVENCINCYN